MGTFFEAYNKDSEREIPYYLFMSACECIGAVTYEKLQVFFDSPHSFYEAGAEKLRSTGVLGDAFIRRIMQVKENFDPVRETEWMKRTGTKLICYEDERYPENLRSIDDYPIALYMKGTLPKEEVPCVSVIGARECSDYGGSVATRLGEALARANIAVVSGMARGIDSISQKAAVYAGGSSIAVLGGGPDVIYPRESRGLYRTLEETGCILSEYVPGTQPVKRNFVRRNRIIAGLSHALAGREAKEKSGTLITVDYALSQGRDVYALPGRITDITSFGTNELIRQGAGVISDINVFIDEISKRYGIAVEEPVLKQNCPGGIIADITDLEKEIVMNMGDNSFTIEQSSAITDIPPFETLGLCMTLCEKNILSSIGAGRFLPTRKGIDIRNALIKEEDKKEEDEPDT